MFGWTGQPDNRVNGIGTEMRQLGRVQGVECGQRSIRNARTIHGFGGDRVGGHHHHCRYRYRYQDKCGNKVTSTIVEGM